MNRTCTIRCSCCALDQAALVALGHPAPLTCARCVSHRTDTDADVLRSAADHVVLHRQALVDAQDAATVTGGERDFYRGRLNDVYADGQRLAATLRRLHDLHHHRGAGCACGIPGCRVVELLAEPGIARVIGTYDEHGHAMRELRYANPGLTKTEWDDIDVTLVYPRGEQPGTGRHRAAG